MHPANAAVRRRISALLAVVLTILLATWSIPANAATAGPDLSVSVVGNFPTGPSTGGPMSLTFTNVGTAPMTGITHLTLDTPPSGLTISPGSVYIQRGAFAVQWSLSAAVSPDGHHVDAWFTGNVAVGAYIGIRASAWAGPAGPSATITGTVANAGDVNPANNLTSVDAVTRSTVPHTSPPAPPTVTSVSPTGGPSTGGTSVVLTGTNLTQGFVTMGDRLATGVVCTDSTCTATTPIGTGSADVRVTTPGGTAVAADQFAYVGDLPTPPPPTVTIVTPPVGAAEGGTAITLNGTNLAGGTVTFGSVPASNVSCADTWCTATSPAGIGVVDVQVTTPGGVSATSTADRFSYRESSPRVSAVSARPPVRPPAGPLSPSPAPTWPADSCVSAAPRRSTARALPPPSARPPRRPAEARSTSR